jgi:hypothetical protein
MTFNRGVTLREGSETFQHLSCPTLCESDSRCDGAGQSSWKCAVHELTSQVVFFFYWQFLSNGGCRAKGIIAIHHHWHIQHLFEVQWYFYLYSLWAIALAPTGYTMHRRGRATGYIMYRHVYVNKRQLTSARPTLNSVTYELRYMDDKNREIYEIYERWSYRSETAIDLRLQRMEWHIC